MIFMKLKKLIYKLSNGFSILPFMLGLSITNVCNRKCSFCLYQSPKLKSTPFLRWLRKQPAMMDVKQFELFINKMGFVKKFIKHVGLTGKGEPLLHPDFDAFCMILEKNKISFSVTTNGDFLDGFLDELLNLKYLKVIRVSIYEIETYYKYKNMPKIEFYNMIDENILVEEGIKLWAKGLDGENTIPKNFNTIQSCRKPFSYITLNPDGAITLCNSWFEVGTWNDNFFKLLNNKKTRHFRKLALKMQNVPNTDCLNCAFNKI